MPCYAHPLSAIAKCKPYIMHNLSSQEASQTLAAYNFNLKRNETIIMKDSGSNTHLVTQRDIPTLGMPDLVKEKSGRLNGIGQSPTLGTTPLIISLKTQTNQIHIHVGKPAKPANQQSKPSECQARARRPRNEGIRAWYEGLRARHCTCQTCIHTFRKPFAHLLHTF